MRLKQQEAEKERKRKEEEEEKLAKRSLPTMTVSANLGMLSKIKKSAHTLAKKQTIKRSSNYEKGHPWHCNLCGKMNRGVMVACQVGIDSIMFVVVTCLSRGAE